MKTPGCCPQCSKYNLVCMTLGHLVARRIAFNRDEVLGVIYKTLDLTVASTDQCVRLMFHHDNVTKMMANAEVPGMPKEIHEMFRDRRPTFSHLKQWKAKHPKEKLYLEKDLEPYIREYESNISPGPEIVADLPETSAVLSTFNTIRLIEFLMFCKSHGKKITALSNWILIGAKMKQWQIDFIYDLGQNFYLNTAEFYAMSHIFANEDMLQYDIETRARLVENAYTFPEESVVMEEFGIENVYPDCYPIDEILSIAEFFSNLSATAEGTRLFETDPPTVGMMSRFPDELYLTKKKPRSGVLYTNDRGESVIVNGSVVYCENTKSDNPNMPYARAAHSFSSKGVLFNTAEKTVQESIVLKR